MKLPTTLPEVPELITSKRDEIAALCREYGVARLELFGSIMTDEFDLQRSDIDFIVDYLPGADLGVWLARYQDLRMSLAHLRDREVDLVMSDSGAMRNPFFRRVADPTRKVVFDARQSREAA